MGEIRLLGWQQRMLMLTMVVFGNGVHCRPAWLDPKYTTKDIANPDQLQHRAGKMDIAVPGQFHHRDERMAISDVNKEHTSHAGILEDSTAPFMMANTPDKAAHAVQQINQRGIDSRSIKVHKCRFGKVRTMCVTVDNRVVYVFAKHRTPTQTMKRVLQNIRIGRVNVSESQVGDLHVNNQREDVLRHTAKRHSRKPFSGRNQRTRRSSIFDDLNVQQILRKYFSRKSDHTKEKSQFRFG